jgi:hypothetical protein
MKFGQLFLNLFKLLKLDAQSKLDLDLDLDQSPLKGVNRGQSKLMCTEFSNQH